MTKTTPATLSVHTDVNAAESALTVEAGTIKASDLLKATGVGTYDPGFMATAAVKSAITFIDGDAGILRYRGYPIEEIAGRKNFLEVAYLLLEGEFPDKVQLEKWTDEVTHHTFIHENVKGLIDAFRYDAHPMGLLMSTVAALSTFYPEAKNVDDIKSRKMQTLRLLAKMPTIAAFAYRHALGLPYVYPDNDLDYVGNFMSMLWKVAEVKYQPNTTLRDALEVLLVLHADHEQNCSTSAVRVVGSARSDPYAALAAGIGALYGPLHGGANEMVLRMLKGIGSVNNVKDHIEKVKSGEVRLMGFGHRVYKNFDPRATLIKQVANQVFEVTGRNPLLDIALELEKVALNDDYFISRKLYPNVDFYSGLIYQAMGFPVEMFPVLFAIGRTPGWLAQWAEGVTDLDQKISRPRQIYIGSPERHL